jgi:oxaloacetate decarboxylase beta subunit
MFGNLMREVGVVDRLLKTTQNALMNIVTLFLGLTVGAAGVSAVPMAARVVQKVGQEENPSNHLLMHAMGPNFAGVIGSAIAAGTLLSILG